MTPSPYPCHNRPPFVARYLFGHKVIENRMSRDCQHTLDQPGDVRCTGCGWHGHAVIETENKGGGVARLP